MGGVAVLTQPSYTCLRRGKSPSCRCRRLHEAALIVERELDSTGRKTADKNMQGQHRFLSPFFFSLSRSSSRDSRREITLRSRLLNFFNPLPPPSPLSNYHEFLRDFIRTSTEGKSINSDRSQIGLRIDRCFLSKMSSAVAFIL